MLLCFYWVPYLYIHLHSAYDFCCMFLNIAKRVYTYIQAFYVQNVYFIIIYVRYSVPMHRYMCNETCTCIVTLNMHKFHAIYLIDQRVCMVCPLFVGTLLVNIARQLGRYRFSVQKDIHIRIYKMSITSIYIVSYTTQ